MEQKRSEGQGVNMNLRVFLAILANELDLVGERRFGFGADVVKDVGVACLGQSRVDRGQDLGSHLGRKRLRCRWRMVLSRWRPASLNRDAVESGRREWSKVQGSENACRAYLPCLRLISWR